MLTVVSYKNRIWLGTIIVLAATVSASLAQDPRGASDQVTLEPVRQCLAPVLTIPGVWQTGNYLFVSARGVSEFKKRLNSAGRCGYQMDSLTKWPLARNQTLEQMIMFAVMKYVGKEFFEYDWFEAFTPGETQTRINFRAQSGFYFREVLPFSVDACGKSDNTVPGKSDTERIFDQAIDSLSFYYGGIYFVEKRSNSNFKPEYKVAIGVIGSGKSPSKQLEMELRESPGFLPVAFGTYKIQNRYAIGVLLEKGVGRVPVTGSDLHVIRSEFGFEKKIRTQAKAGFEMILSGEMGAFRHALLQRKADGAVRQYAWLDATSTNFEKQLQQLSNNSFRQVGLKTRAFECDSAETQMLFALTDKPANSKYKYAMLKLDLPPYLDIQTSSDSEISRLFAEFLDKGFVFKDLYFDSDIYAIFEKANGN